MTLMPGKTRLEVVACLAAVYNEGDAASFSVFGSTLEEEELIKRIDDISGVPEAERLSYTTERLRSFLAREKFVDLSDIHPSWLVEVLSKESPRIVGIILRYLPSKQVRYIIEHLPKRIKQRLPQLLEAFAVPAPILNIIKERFERQFLSPHISRDFDEFEFQNISCLKNTDLEVLFRDLGIHELAMALKGVDRRSLNILFNRLSIDEARNLQQRIRSLVDISPSLLRDAKYTVLEMNITETDSDDLLVEIGLNAFARSLDADDIDIFPLIKQKLEPRLGYTLKRYIDRHVGSNFASVIDKRKELILLRLEALARAGSIDQNLARHFDDIDEPVHEISDTASHQVPINNSVEPDSWQGEDGVI